MASKSDNTLPGEIKSLPDPEEILKLLECPCCLEPPVPPIISCKAGHIICSFCRPRLTRCAICREPYTDTRNYPLETIFNGCRIACKFWGRGCHSIVSGGKYVDHVKICQYRTLYCVLCKETISPVDKYVEHLKDKHLAVGYEDEMESYQCKNIISDLINDVRFPDQFAKFDGRYFTISAQTRSHFLHIWVSLLENLELTVNSEGHVDDGASYAALKKMIECSKYTAVISMSQNDLPVPLLRWTIPIFPLQNGDPDPALIVRIPVDPTFQAFTTKCPDTADMLETYSWSFTYQIVKDAGK